ncbi:MAG: hypothetical protein F2565_00460 [Actinobacteria bacterium]|nr:hypothetical protein [Actinomycetota bacterium]
MQTSCLYCKDKLDDSRCPRCADCGASHHLSCWKEYGGCAQFGCVSGPVSN